MRRKHKARIKIWLIVTGMVLAMAGLAWAQQGQSLTITYCDGSTQEVALDKPADSIKSLDFGCGTGATGATGASGATNATGATGAGGAFGSTQQMAGSLRGDIYFLPEGTRALPDFNALTPVGTIYTDHLDIPPQAFDQGFPGVTDRFEWFAIRYQGVFQVTRAGEYGFRLSSDDGSKLYIDDDLIINNDGTHSARGVSGSVALAAGTHRIRVEYFQGPRVYVALQLFMTPPSGEERLF